MPTYYHTCPKHGLEQCRCRGYLWHECSKGDEKIVPVGPGNDPTSIWSHTWREPRKKGLAQESDAAQSRLEF